ncbi:MAG: thymidine phosphorylase [Candidatus Cloacimonetes bacterium]|jgi:pyrimidine-nucleoside phosphorylase|nr:thymidine phosphorylase [Candidatus Cloacimonadota bacterium]
MNFNPVEIILKKRSDETLTRDEMTFMVQGYINGLIPDYQMSAFLMSIYFKGMNIEEVINLTDIYIKSGSKINFEKSLKTVDKHSTGGVGDKITMTLAPIVAACGAKIPMISGRGLGHTGGTLDKLESIPGFLTDFTEEKFQQMVLDNGLAIIAQSKSLVPADKKIYALRDVTGTVESLPLICASIMSKKIAEGAQNLVIDLKVGSGAFMKTLEEAEDLAELLKATGENFGQKVSVVFTKMDSPLGYAIGNALEIIESIEYLKGKEIPDIDTITRALSVEMLLLTEIAKDEEDANNKISEVIYNKSALKKFGELIKLQGGNPEVIDNYDLFPKTTYRIPIIANKSGYITKINSQKIGYSLIKIGAGRIQLDSALDMGSGCHLYKKIGDKLNTGDEIGEIYSNDKESASKVANEIISAIYVSDTDLDSESLIIKVLR